MPPVLAGRSARRDAAVACSPSELPATACGAAPCGLPPRGRTIITCNMLRGGGIGGANATGASCNASGDGSRMSTGSAESDRSRRNVSTSGGGGAGGPFPAPATVAAIAWRPCCRALAGMARVRPSARGAPGSASPTNASVAECTGGRNDELLPTAGMRTPLAAGAAADTACSTRAVARGTRWGPAGRRAPCACGTCGCSGVSRRGDAHATRRPAVVPPASRWPLSPTTAPLHAAASLVRGGDAIASTASTAAGRTAGKIGQRPATNYVAIAEPKHVMYITTLHVLQRDGATQLPVLLRACDPNFVELRVGYRWCHTPPGPRPPALQFKLASAHRGS